MWGIGYNWKEKRTNRMSILFSKSSMVIMSKLYVKNIAVHGPDHPGYMSTTMLVFVSFKRYFPNWQNAYQSVSCWSHYRTTWSDLHLWLSSWSPASSFFQPFYLSLLFSSSWIFKICFDNSYYIQMICKTKPSPVKEFIYTPARPLTHPHSLKERWFQNM